MGERWLEQAGEGELLAGGAQPGTNSEEPLDPAVVGGVVIKLIGKYEQQ